MTREQFEMAISLISQFHSTKVSINLPRNHFVGDIGKKEFRLHITECCPAVIDTLKNGGFMLEMTPDGLQVNKIRED